jgi:hypothetical protein
MPTVLHVGCGGSDIRNMPKFFQDGSWTEIRLDIDPTANPDVIGTMTDMTAVATGSVQAVFSSHNIEHLYPHEVPAALAEFKRVLSPDGFTLITCPDLQAVAALVADDKLLDTAYMSPAGPITPLDILYGHRGYMQQGNLYMAHHGGFTMRTLAGSLTEVGFKRAITYRRPTHFDLWGFATLGDHSEDEVKALAMSMFPG